MSPPLWLVPTDFSPGSEAAFQKALEMAAELHGELLVVHVVLELRGLPGFFITRQPLSALQHELEEEAEKKLDALRQEGERRGICTRVALLRGTPVPALLRAAHDAGVEMIILGQEVAKAGQQLWGGSPVPGLVAHPPCPVLVVPSPAPPGDPRPA